MFPPEALPEPLSPHQPIYELPPEVAHPTYPSRLLEPRIPGRHTITPHWAIGDDHEATDTPGYDAPEEILGAETRPTSTELAVGVTAASESVEPAELAVPPKAPYEVRRTKERTVLVSTTHPNKQLVERAADELSKGAADTWPEHYDGTGSSPKYLVDRVKEPTVFVKVHGDVRTYQQRITTLKNLSVDPRIMQITARDARKRISISHEMRLAPEISAALKDGATQEIVQNAGFEGVDLVEPLAAVIDAKTGQRATAYAWQPGDPVGVMHYENRADQNTPKAWFDYMTELRGLAVRLSQHLATRGIKAIDMHPGNFIISTGKNGKRLHIIDCERFEQIPPAQPPQAVSEPINPLIDDLLSNPNKLQ